MNQFWKTFLFLAALAASNLACAQWAKPPAASEEQIQQRLQERFGPRVQVQNVRKTNYLGGLYEFRVGNQMGYTDDRLTYIFLGDIIEGGTMKNLSEARMAELDRIPFDQLPLQLALKTVRGNGKRKVAIFEDPNCGYCRMLQKEIRELNNVTIYSFVYPILGPDSLAKSRKVMCSANPAQAWQEWMLYGRMADNKGDCKTALEQIARYGQEHNVSSTPTLFFENGERVAGAIEMEKMEQFFKAAEK